MRSVRVVVGVREVKSPVERLYGAGGTGDVFSRFGVDLYLLQLLYLDSTRIPPVGDRTILDAR